MGVRLPAEYQEVTCIIGQGTQYIDTGYVLNSECRVQGRYDLYESTKLGSVVALFGARDSNYNNAFAMFNVTAAPRIDYGKTLTTHSFYYVTINDRSVVDFDLNAGIATVNGRTYAFADSLKPFTCPSTALIFAAHTENTVDTRRPKGEIVYLKITDENGTVVRDMIPCYRKSDNKPGMYDLVSKTFYTNQGTGEFLVGPDVVNHISPWLVARRRALTARKPFDCPYVTDGLVLWLDGINKGNTPNAWDDLISGYSFEDYSGQVVFGSDYVEFADNKNCYLHNQDFDAPRYTDGTIEIVYETNIAHAQILFCPKSQLSIAYGVGASSVIWVKNVMAGTRPNMHKYPRFTSGSVSISLNSAYYDGAVQQNTGIDIWSDDDCASTAIGKTYYRDDRCFGGKIYCIRIYNRQLTEAEVLANYAVDRSRFSLFS